MEKPKFLFFFVKYKVSFVHKIIMLIFKNKIFKVQKNNDNKRFKLDFLTSIKIQKLKIE